jgi:hypothetical protein
MNAPKTESWPRLGYKDIHVLADLGLDYLVPEYDAEWFRHVAKCIESGQLLPAAARCLLHLADTPGAIKALNHHRPLVPREILGLNRAVHYYVRLELLGLNGMKKPRVETARDEVATVWRTERTTIKDDAHDFCKEVQRILDKIIEDMLARPDASSRRKILEDFDADMEGRAKRMSKSNT